MDIATKTVTTRVHSAVAKTDEFKDVAILAVKRKLGIQDSAIVSAEATVGEDGSISVELVESVTSDDKPKDSASNVPDLDASSDDEPASQPAAPTAPVAIPMGIVGG